jgi:mannose/cellobiose epimerase-like protein (N-acyl-D-glucosamine 2-epimerase family)/anti-anti-sigma regulatory factor
VPAVNFTFSDTIAGYVTSYDEATDTFGMKTPGGDEFKVTFGANCYAELVRNLGEPFQDCTGPMRSMLTPGRFLFTYGIFFPEDELRYEVKHLIFLGRNPDEYRFEASDWWVKQVRQIADFYLKAQFPDGEVDYSQYRTQLTLEGTKVGSLRQETDTISRMIYGFASAYLMTGEDRFLEAAEKGTEYLRKHLRFIDHDKDIVYWYHGIDVKAGHERKIFASEFGDDYDAIPAYEQIYALAGPTQTFRITGDPAILDDIRMTINLFDRHYADPDKGGYFSHIDPVTFDPRDDSLGPNRARKNWNSVGDHAPAYLINLVLATGDQRYADFLVNTGDTIERYFQDYDHSPFVQEKFHEDWSHDKTWGWQQNRGVVGHNLKIAWNLMRIHHMRPNEKYVEFARKIAEVMPEVGGDRQRGGWYDVMDRERQPGQKFNRYAWHDRKAWWQQEQGILAYLILAGSLKEPQYEKLARESVAFYNAFFLDNDSGAVYFNVLASGMPYLLGNERLKGSHSMSGYHSTELCYLSAVYSNLLVTRQPMDLHFKPKPKAWKDNILRVAPDLLPEGSVRIEEVWIDGQRHTDFDAAALTVKLPESDVDLRVKVRVAPAVLADTFTAETEIEGDTATLVLYGALTVSAVPALRAELAKVIAAQPKCFVVDASDLTSIDAECGRALVFAKQKLDIDVDMRLTGACRAVVDVLCSEELDDEMEIVDSDSPSEAPINA